jgi:hypothetical protein
MYTRSDSLRVLLESPRVSSGRIRCLSTGRCRSEMLDSLCPRNLIPTQHGMFDGLRYQYCWARLLHWSCSDVGPSGWLIRSTDLAIFATPLQAQHSTWF